MKVGLSIDLLRKEKLFISHTLSIADQQFFTRELNRNHMS
jgi:hypothetical protein